MHYLLKNTTLDLKVQLLQTLPGHFPEKILQGWTVIGYPVQVRQVYENSKEKIIELRLDNVTLSYHYEEGRPCHTGYLFPDDEDEIEEYIRFFNKHYIFIRSGVWLNKHTQTLIRVINDEDVGYMISCTKGKPN